MIGPPHRGEGNGPGGKRTHDSRTGSRRGDTRSGWERYRWRPVLPLSPGAITGPGPGGLQWNSHRSITYIMVNGTTRSGTISTHGRSVTESIHGTPISLSVPSFYWLFTWILSSSSIKKIYVYMISSTFELIWMGVHVSEIPIHSVWCNASLTGDSRTRRNTGVEPWKYPVCHECCENPSRSPLTWHQSTVSAT